MGTLAQRSFAGGEIAPAIYPRCDTVKYVTGLRRCRNFFVKKHGGASNRPGTSFICEVKESAKVTRLIPYKYTDELTSVLEFGDDYARVVNSGVQVRLTAQNITGITNANPAVLTYAGADSYANGDQVRITGIVGAIGDFLNDRDFLVANLNAGLNTFELRYLDGTNVNSTAFGAYGSAGTVAEVLQINPPNPDILYEPEELFDLQYSQNGSTLTLCHQSHIIVEIIATALTTWTLATADLRPEIPVGPDDVLGTRGGPGTETFRYIVTAVSEDFEESVANTKEGNRAITGGTATNPAVLTVASANVFFKVGDLVTINKAFYASGVIDGDFVISAVGAATVTIPFNATGFGAYTGPGEIYHAAITVHNADPPTVAAPIVLTWTAVPGAREYNIYKEKQGIYGFHGSTTNTTYEDEGGDGDLQESPPENRIDLHRFGDATTYPGVVGTIQQRRAFARTSAALQTFWASKTAFPNNFTVHFPIVDDDSVKARLAGEGNEIRHILDLGSIVLLTKGGEWVMQGDTSGILTPSQINPKQVGYNGSSEIRPVIVNNNALYIQARGNIIRDLAFDFSVDGYKGNDLTIFSDHLFKNYTIVDWAYQQVPDSIVWAVRSDGTLLALTYIREQDILAWHRHDLAGGFVESVCTIPEGEEDALYLLVRRTINGATKRYIERLNTRVIDDVVDSVFMDCAKSFDGRHTGATTMTLSGGVTWAYDETLTLTASVSTFTAADVGKAVHLVGSDGSKIRFTITGYTSGTVITGRPHKTVPVPMRTVAIGNGSGSWGLAIFEVKGLWHLEGQTVSIFADGFVLGSPNNEAYTTYTVTNGKVTLEKPYLVIHVGLPITADIETLDIDTAQGESLVDKKKNTSRFTAWFEDSRGLWSGPKPPEDDDDNEDNDPLFGLFEMRWRDADVSLEEPPELFTGTKTDLIRPEWSPGGRVFLRQVDPVPVSVSAIAPTGMMPFR